MDNNIETEKKDIPAAETNYVIYGTKRPEKRTLNKRVLWVLLGVLLIFLIVLLLIHPHTGEISSEQIATVSVADETDPYTYRLCGQVMGINHECHDGERFCVYDIYLMDVPIVIDIDGSLYFGKNAISSSEFLDYYYWHDPDKDGVITAFCDKENTLEVGDVTEFDFVHFEYPYNHECMGIKGYFNGNLRKKSDYRKYEKHYGINAVKGTSKNDSYSKRWVKSKCDYDHMETVMGLITPIEDIKANFSNGTEQSKNN